jgi:hypothetical protein
MQSPPISQAEIDARIHGDIDDLLELWWAELGASKPRDVELIALAIPFPRDQAIRVLDLCMRSRVFTARQIDMRKGSRSMPSICALG